MYKKIMLGLALVAFSTVSLAAGVSVTTFSGNSFSNSFTVGATNDVTAYTGFTAAIETAPEVFSSRIESYVGSSIDTTAYAETNASTSQFQGTATNNGLVGRTVQTSTTQSYTAGAAVSTSIDNKVGTYAEISLVGSSPANGIVGGEIGVYSESAYEVTVSNYGSEVYSDSYAANSYGL